MPLPDTQDHILAYWQQIQKRQAVCNVYPAHFSGTKGWNQRDGCRGKVCSSSAMVQLTRQQPHRGRTGICSVLSPRVNHCPLCWGETYCEGGWQCQLSSQITLLAPRVKRRLWELMAQAPYWEKHWICGETATTARPTRTCSCSLLCTQK